MLPHVLADDGRPPLGRPCGPLKMLVLRWENLHFPPASSDRLWRSSILGATSPPRRTQSPPRVALGSLLVALGAPEAPLQPPTVPQKPPCGPPRSPQGCPEAPQRHPQAPPGRPQVATPCVSPPPGPTLWPFENISFAGIKPTFPASELCHRLGFFHFGPHKPP